MQGASSLLNQLRIDRRDGVERQGSQRRRRRVSAVIAIVCVGALIAWFADPAAIPAPAHTLQRAEPAALVVPESTAHSPGTGQLDTSGYIVARRQATVSAKTTGRVAEVLIEEGQRVEKGQVIARLDSSNTNAVVAEMQARLGQAEADLAAAQQACDDADPIFRRNEQQHAAGLISRQAFDNARAAYNATRSSHTVRQRAVEVARAMLLVALRNQEDTVIRAPFTGIVTVKAAQPGEIVSPLSASSGFARTGIGTIVDMDSMEVEVDVSESFIARVHLGQQATVRLNAYPDWRIPAETIAVIPTADRARATVKVRVGFKERDPRILPDMGAKVTFLTE